jgi:site-specific DNA-methyltransferase (adenine-specific)
MTKEAVTTGFYTSALWKQDYPRIQIITIQDLLEGRAPQLPPSTAGAYKKAQRVRLRGPEQGTLGV